MYPYHTQGIPAPFQKNIVTPISEASASPNVSIQNSSTSQKKQTTNTTYSAPGNTKMALLSILLLDQFLS